MLSFILIYAPILTIAVMYILFMLLLYVALFKKI
jgi:hypothetical protein